MIPIKKKDPGRHLFSRRVDKRSREDIRTTVKSYAAGILDKLRELQ